MQSGLVFNIQRYSIHDGPGIRTTVFLKGCPLRCSWCHNPEGQSAAPEIAALPNRCVRCGSCVEACPQQGSPAAACTRCGACVDACPTGARQMVGRSMTVAEVLAEVRKDRLFYDDSGGGATFSGGEPLWQPGFLRGLLAACRREGIHTALDTCGHAPRGDLLAVAPLVDLFLYDVKTLDDRRHRQLTGVSNAAILDNLRTLAGAHGNIWLRAPIVPGLNYAPEEIDALGRMAASLPAVRQVHLLPYHRLGSHKAAGANGQDEDGRLGAVAAVAASAGKTPAPFAAPPAGHLESIAGRLRAFGLRVLLGG